MSARFEFTPENKREFEKILQRYPFKRAAMLPTFHLAQEQNGYISGEVEQYVAEILEVPLVDVREVLSFYSLFLDRKPGRHQIRLRRHLHRLGRLLHAHLPKKNSSHHSAPARFLSLEHLEALRLEPPAFLADPEWRFS